VTVIETENNSCATIAHKKKSLKAKLSENESTERLGRTWQTFRKKKKKDFKKFA
jgi:hypothetical protein